MRHPFILWFILITGFQISISAAENVRVLTLNVLADPVSKSKRVTAINQIIKTENPDIICFQETAPWFVNELGKTDFFEKYDVVQKDGIYVVVRGLMIAMRKDFGKLGDVTYAPLPSRQGRYFMIQQIDLEGIGQIAVATTHLESFLEDAELRRKQLDLIFKNLVKNERVIFAADFNFGDDGKTELAAIPKEFTDAWKTVNPKDTGYTWNIEKSLMAKNGSFPNEKSRRLDHIYIKGRHQVTDAKIVGNKEIDTNLFPSDHFGVLVNFLWHKN